MPLLLLFPKKILTPCFRKAVALRTENTVSTANSKRARIDRKILSSLKMSMERAAVRTSSPMVSAVTLGMTAKVLPLTETALIPITTLC